MNRTERLTAKQNEESIAVATRDVPLIVRVWPLNDHNALGVESYAPDQPNSGYSALSQESAYRLPKEFRSGRSWRWPRSFNRARSLGTELFESIFLADDKSPFHTTYRKARSDNGRLLLYLLIHPTLAHLPWELLYDHQGPSPGFLALSEHILLARGIDPASDQAISADQRSPTSNRSWWEEFQSPGSTFGETAALDKAAHALFTPYPEDSQQFLKVKIEDVHRRSATSLELHNISMRAVRGVNESEIRRQFRVRRHNTIWFTGDCSTKQGGGLAMHAPDGTSQHVSSARFLELVGHVPSTVVLQYPSAHHRSVTRAGQAVAEDLHRAGVRTVVRVPLLDSPAASRALLTEWYNTLATGGSVFEATCKAKRKLALASFSLDWASIVLSQAPTAMSVSAPDWQHRDSTTARFHTVNDIHQLRTTTGTMRKGSAGDAIALLIDENHDLTLVAPEEFAGESASKRSTVTSDVAVDWSLLGASSLDTLDENTVRISKDDLEQELLAWGRNYLSPESAMDQVSAVDLFSSEKMIHGMYYLETIVNILDHTHEFSLLAFGNELRTLGIADLKRAGISPLPTQNYSKQIESVLRGRTRNDSFDDSQEEIPSGPGEPPEADDGNGQWGENLLFSVFYPEKCKPKRFGRLVAYAHIESATESVVDEAMNLLALPNTIEMLASEAPLSCPVKGMEITITPEVPGLTFYPRDAKLWLWEDKQCTVFRFLSDSASESKLCKGKIQFSHNGLPLAHAEVEIFLSAPKLPTRLRADLARVNARPYDKIFPSYSHQDKDFLEQIEKVYRGLGIEFLSDERKLKAGERWNPKLKQLIQDSSIFLLLWSDDSSTSPYVTDEWNFALKERSDRPDLHFLRPIYWTDELVEPIPEPLGELHFQRIEF